MSFLLDRFTEFDLFVIVLPLLLKVTMAAYPVLQGLALVRMDGSWRKASLVPFVAVLATAVFAAWSYVQQSPLWMALPLTVIPIATLLLAAMWMAYLWHRRAVQAGVFAIVTVALVFVVAERGFGWRVGGSPAQLRGEYQTEDEWIATEITRDIAEMAEFSGGATSFRRLRLRRSEAGLYAVTFDQTSLDLDLRQGLWDPAAFVHIAEVILSRQASTPNRDEGGFPSVYERLLEPDALRLVALAQTASQALSTNMKNVAAHEAAALTIGAFALRESAGHFQDVRWALNRMTAHLAIARALRGRGLSERSIDGSLAEAALLTLANEEIRAVQLLSTLSAQHRFPAIDAWDRALRIRLTQDWRLLPEPPSATLLEKSEYLRARREGAWGTRAAPDFAELRIDPAQSAHWLRIIQNGYRGVEEGNLFSEAALKLERAEAADVFQRMTIEGDLETRLNDRASRCISAAKANILPWGAWAEFFQRHLAMLVGNVNRHYVLGLGLEAEAVTSDLALDGALRGLDLFPAATTYRLRGPRGSSADLRRINDAIRFTARSPERVTPAVWAWMQRAAGYEHVKYGMPPSEAWFAEPPMPHDAAARTALPNQSTSAQQLEQLRKRAPSDYGLATTLLRARFGENIPFREVTAVLAPRLEHDLRAVNYAMKRTLNDQEQVALLEAACRMSSIECGALAAVLARLGRADEAAALYEKAFADPAVDAVWKSSASGWLADYHYRSGRPEVARQIAVRAAGVGALEGIVALARVEERENNLASAEDLYRRAAERHDDPAQLLGFYQRRMRQFGEGQWQESWEKWRSGVFPDGLRPEPDSMPTAPVSGVIITADNDRARNAGMQAGDIIVAVEGIRVDNLRQYRAVNASFWSDEMRLTLWRGKLFHVTASAPNRLFGVQIRSYPVSQWGEQ